MAGTITQRHHAAAPTSAQADDDFAGARAAAASAAAAATARRRPSPPSQRASALLPRELVSKHYQDPYILHWYRPSGGFRKTLASLFRLHNETGNVWTHLLGFIIFCCLTAATLRLRPEPLRLGAEALARLEQQLVSAGKSNVLELVQAVESWEARVVAAGASGLGALSGLEERLARIGRENLQDLLHLPGTLRAAGQSGWQEIKSIGVSAGAELAAAESAIHDALAAALQAQWPVARWPVYVFCAGAMLCLFTSATCHLFGCCTAHVANILWRFDYAGIAVLIVASLFPPIFYGFLCSPWTRFFYLLASCVLGFATLGVTLLPAFQRPDWMRFRACLFVGLGLWGAVPGFHAWLANAGEAAVARAVALDLLMGAIYIGGTLLYASRFPERLKPGAFDVAFHSHQLFHVAVVVAACVHYRAVHVLLAWRDASGGCLPPLQLLSPAPVGPPMGL